MTSTLRSIPIAVAAALLFCVASIQAEDDPYENYIKTSKDFKRIKQDPEWLFKAWPTWVYMPWYAQWTIGHNEAGGKFSVDNGYNGAFIDGQSENTNYLDWINQFKLRFYLDHTAGKGFLYIHNSNQVKAKDLVGQRKPLLNDALKTQLEGIMKKRIESVKSSPQRLAYGLDDEISWGSFVKPVFWQVAEDGEYHKWLNEIYGKDKAPKYGNWINYEAIRPKLREFSIGTFDASQLMDQLTFCDSAFNNLLGDLVEYGNSVDPDIPVGYEGVQCPNAFGGFDFAKLTRKVQWAEPYNMGGSLSIFRSLNPKNAMPTVTTFFFNGKVPENVASADGVWQAWYHLAHGNRGMIGWVEGWFDDKGNPKPWHSALAPSYKEIEQKISPLQVKSQWVHDGVGIYYNHASIQLAWIMDAEAHGKTWPNRNADERLGCAHLGRHAWENMLRDEGLQYNYLSYADVIQNGIPSEYKVLILPGAYCLSDVEAAKIKEFCKKGGTVVADYMPGLWDQHGKGRANGGVLDDMFGVKHDPKWKSADVFSGNLWCETDQDANFSYKTYEELLTNNCHCVKDASGFNKGVREMAVNKSNKFGQGTAVLLNLSPLWYNAYRGKGPAEAAKREIFMKPIKDAGCARWVSVDDPAKTFGCEITYWEKDGKKLLFLVSNPEVTGSSEGGGNAAGLKTDDVEVTLTFKKPVGEITDERTGKSLGGGSSCKVHWKMNEAVVLSFK